MPENSRLVYSTDGGRTQPTPHNRKVEARAKAPVARAAPNDGIVRIQRDRRGRGGKTATTVSGLPGSAEELETLLRTLKQHCGAGGSLEGRTLAIQGDQRERLREQLESLGYRVKLAGG